MDVMQPLAIFGGTFDPVHNGHLRAAWEASEALDADVCLVPAGIPAHRPRPVATTTQRVAMLRAALAGQPRLRLDLRELERTGPSYTFDTLASLRAEVGAVRPLVALIGADAFAGLSSWHRWRELFGFAHMCVLTRPAQIPDLPDALAVEIAARTVETTSALRAEPCGKVLNLVVTSLGVSATRIRALLAGGREPRWLVPDALLANPGLLEPYRHRRDRRPGTGSGDS